MSKLKKDSRIWYLAFTHSLTVGFAIPFIFLTLWRMVLLPMLQKMNVSYLPEVGTIFFSIFVLWLSVWYSARYINNTYYVENKKKLLIFSTVYFAVVQFGIDFLIILNSSSNIDFLLYWLLYSTYIIIFISIVNIVYIYAFYYFSKKYIKEDRRSEN